MPETSKMPPVIPKKQHLINFGNKPIILTLTTHFYLSTKSSPYTKTTVDLKTLAKVFYKRYPNMSAFYLFSSRDPKLLILPEERIRMETRNLTALYHTNQPRVCIFFILWILNKWKNNWIYGDLNIIGSINQSLQGTQKWSENTLYSLVILYLPSNLQILL